MIATGALLPCDRANAAEDEPEEFDQAKLHFETALKYIDQKNYESALSELLEASNAVSRKSIQLNIAYCYDKLGDYIGAYNTYVAVLGDFPDQLTAREKLMVSSAIKRLLRMTGAINIDINEIGAAVYIDDRRVGATPLAKEVRQSVGIHHVEVSKPGFETIRRDITVISGWTTPVRDEMLPNPSGELAATLAGDVPAPLWVDGVMMGPLPWTGPLTSGKHVIQAKSGDRQSDSEEIEVVAGQSISKQLTLSPVPLGTLRILTGASDAAVFLDGKPIGMGDQELRVPIGAHRVEVSREGGDRHTEVITIEAGKTGTMTAFEHGQVKPAPALPVARTAERSSQSQPLVEYDYHKWYLRLGLAAASPVYTMDHVGKCPNSVTCRVNPELGGALLVHLGYGAGIAGFEGYLIGENRRDKASITYATAIASGGATQADYSLDQSSATLGIAVRLMSKGGVLRFSSALGTGIAFNQVKPTPQSATSPGSSTSSSGTAPTQTLSQFKHQAAAISLDAGLLLGRSPGFKVYVGGFANLQFAPMAAAFDGNLCAALVPGSYVVAGAAAGVQFGN